MTQLIAIYIVGGLCFVCGGVFGIGLAFLIIRGDNPARKDEEGS
jgi:hypothetical protein